MADNITTPTGTFASKDLGGVHIPKNAIVDQTGADALGVVAASPSANTVLGRLKAAVDALLGLDAKLPTLGPKAASGSLSTTLSTDQDPIYDHAAGVKVNVTASAAVLTPPASCKFVEITSDVDVFIRTDDTAVVDDGKAKMVKANAPQVVPVAAGVPIRALSSAGTAVVRCLPLKAR
jgi:hypothetical protein